MARFDAYLDPSGSGFLLDVQADVFESMKTRIVVPLLRPRPSLIRTPRLNPVIVVAGEDFLMITQSLSAVPVSMLRKRAAGLTSQSDLIRDALDFLLVGF